MSQATPIEWTDVSWNPVRGCSRISPGCENCYAEVMAARFSDEGMWGHGYAERTSRGGRWTRKVALVPEKLGEPLSWRKPRRCFVNSTSDLFHENLPHEDIAAVYGVMMACQGTTFQVLTKRPERRREFHAWLRQMGDPQGVCEEAAMAALPAPVCHLQAGEHGWPLPNVWEGVSVESPDYLWRLEELIETPAALRFVSAEPLLGPLDISPYLKSLHWVIAGGESGQGARPLEVEWVRSIVRQCRAAGVPVFVKQLGARPVVLPSRLRHYEWPGATFAASDPLHESTAPWYVKLRDRKGGDMSEWPEGLRVREMPS